MNQINQTSQTNLIVFRLFLAGLISFLVGIADEYHQVFVPGREGGFSDVLLDLAGIILAVLFVLRILRQQRPLMERSPHVPKSNL
jgi:VanZ family protein